MEIKDYKSLIIMHSYNRIMEQEDKIKPYISIL